MSTAQSALDPTIQDRPMQALGSSMDRFSYDDKVVRAFTLMTLVWGNRNVAEGDRAF